MAKLDERKYRIKCHEKISQLCMKDEWTDADKLRLMLYDINPYFYYWRNGMIKALKHAIRLLEKEEKGDDKE